MMGGLSMSRRPGPVASVAPVRTTARYDNGSSTAKELYEAPAGEAQRNEAPAGEAQRDEAPAGEARLHVASPAGGGAPRRYRHVAMGLALSDALCVVVALVASYALRYPGELVPAREAVVIALAPLRVDRRVLHLRPVRPPAPVGS